MCVTMLVGTTLAWFTDSASTSVDKIEAGRLKVDIVDAGNTDTSLKGGEMSFVNKDNSANILWEPGATFKTPAFRIKNAGNLALKYKLALNGVIGDNELLDVIKNATVAVGTDDATRSSWDAHDIVFKGDVAFENVTFERAVAINGNASFKNCTISDKNANAETYMLWIQAGSNVTLDNCTIDGKSNTTHGNRAIAIKDEYVANAGMTTLTINGGKISSDKKAAVIVSTLGGANITVTGTVDITGVAKDQTNLVWKDSGSNPDNGIAYSTAYDKITVRGASCIVEP